jgi:hypothetical protein
VAGDAGAVEGEEGDEGNAGALPPSGDVAGAGIALTTVPPAVVGPLGPAGAACAAGEAADDAEVAVPAITPGSAPSFTTSPIGSVRKRCCPPLAVVAAMAAAGGGGGGCRTVEITCVVVVGGLIPAVEGDGRPAGGGTGSGDVVTPPGVCAEAAGVPIGAVIGELGEGRGAGAGITAMVGDGRAGGGGGKTLGAGPAPASGTASIERSVDDIGRCAAGCAGETMVDSWRVGRGTR